MSRREARAAAVFQPTNILTVELTEPIPAVEASAPDGRRYEHGLSVVRLHGDPLGLVELELAGCGMSAELHAAAIWDDLATEIETHLRADGIAAPDRLEQGGLTDAGGVPTCIAERQRFLQDPPFMSVIIPTRDRPDHLRRCLESIIATEYPTTRYEVVVADNVPRGDGARRVVDEYARSASVRYVVENAPGSASARNRGIPAAEGELLAFTDDDGIADERWLTELARAYATVPEAASVSGLLLPLELATPAQIWFEQYGGFSRGFTRRVFDLRDNRAADNPLYPYSAGIFGTGNNMSFRRSVLQEIGAFDPALGNGTPALGGVDSEVLLRTILAGHTIVYEPHALVSHRHRPDYAALKRQVYSYGVGLTAYLLKTMLANPRLIPDFARRIPPGLAFALSPQSSKNSKKQQDYPRELTWLELLGMMYGPVAYARSRRKFGPHGGHSVPAGRRRLSPRS